MGGCFFSFYVLVVLAFHSTPPGIVVRANLSTGQVASTPKVEIGVRYPVSINNNKRPEGLSGELDLSREFLFLLPLLSVHQAQIVLVVVP